jgi:GNAT superfamily N-acetyltransferase
MSEIDGASVRLLNAGDSPAAVQLSAEAGWNQTREDWQLLVDLAPEGCLATEVNGELAATTTLFCYGQRLAWIGMVLTKVSCRGRGLARGLLTEALRQADRKGVETVKLDATDQGQPLYEELGFRSEQVVERWSRPGPNGVPGSAGAAPRSREWNALDPEAFGVDRSQLLARLAQRNPPFCVAGSYLFTRPGRRTAYLGPCVASDIETARTLVGRALQAAGSCGWFWDLLPNNTNAVAVAQDLDFTPNRRLLRMVRGKNLQGHHESIYAISGFELG